MAVNYPGCISCLHISPSFHRQLWQVYEWVHSLNASAIDKAVPGSWPEFPDL